MIAGAEGERRERARRSALEHARSGSAWPPAEHGLCADYPALAGVARRRVVAESWSSSSSNERSPANPRTSRRETSLMNPTRSNDSARRTRRASALYPSLAAVCVAASASAQTPCAATADAALQACRAEALDDLWVQRAKCVNLPTTGAMLACNRAAMNEY